MDECIRTGVSATDAKLPGRLGLRRRAPILYRRLMRGFYSGIVSPKSSFGRITAPSEDTTLLGPPVNDDPELDSVLATAKAASEEQESAFVGGARKVNADFPMTKRAARVTGSFNHPILPHPPVSPLVPSLASQHQISSGSRGKP